MNEVAKYRREYADGWMTPWFGSALAGLWAKDYVAQMLDPNRPAYCAKLAAVHLRLANGQLVTIRPRAKG